MKFGKPLDPDYNSVRNWVESEFPVGTREKEYFFFKNDFVSIQSSDAGNPKSKLERYTKRIIAERQWPWLKVRHNSFIAVQIQSRMM